MTDNATGQRLLIALDVDGTVVLEDESPSPGVIDAVAEAVQGGHEVMLATGRSWAATGRIMELLGIRPEYAVCANGAAIYKLGADGEYERFHTEVFDPSPALDLLEQHLPDAHYMVEHGDGTRLYTDEMHDWSLNLAHQVTFEELKTEPVSRIVVVSPEHDEKDFAELVSSIGLNQVSYAVGWTAWLDIAPQGVDKGSGLDLVCAWLGHDRANTVVIGDGRNDLGMFAWAQENGGTAVAMGQAPEEVKEAASYITRRVHDGGVTDVLRGLNPAL